MPSDFGKKLKLKRGDSKSGAKGGLTAMLWKEKTKGKYVHKHAL
jgi:hypothetical protein